MLEPNLEPSFSRNDSEVQEDLSISNSACTKPCSILDNNENKKNTKKSRGGGITKNWRLWKLQVEAAVLSCEWNMCSHSTQKMEKFLFHVAEHLGIFSEPPGPDGLVCLWRSCGFATQSRSEFDRHVYFHVFHTRIKAFGQIVMQQFNIKCTMDLQNRNIIPEIPEPFECLWGGCRFVFCSAQDFYWHVEGHVNSVEPNDQGYRFCSWEECCFVGSNASRLRDHSRSHSQEKVIGCPQCGSIFSSNAKLKDHCFRRVDQDMLKFECSHCKSKFGTERLLKEHVRRHINHFKCPHCEMTCTSKKSLSVHIRYRHSDTKPFKCPECPKRFKVHHDVFKHMVSHSSGARFVCYYPDCDYMCRAADGFTHHIKRVHEGGPAKPYICHMCDKNFSIGSRLTVHLKNVHDYHWPPGHSRFRYSKGEDGYFRLQTTRFESMELAQMMSEKDDLDDPDEEALLGQEPVGYDHDDVKDGDPGPNNDVKVDERGFENQNLESSDFRESMPELLPGVDVIFCDEDFTKTTTKRRRKSILTDSLNSGYS